MATEQDVIAATLKTLRTSHKTTETIIEHIVDSETKNPKAEIGLGVLDTGKDFATLAVQSVRRYYETLPDETQEV